MGCGDTCPIFPGKRYLDWELDDPADKPIDQVRLIRDDLEQRIRNLLPHLTRRFVEFRELPNPDITPARVMLRQCPC